MTLEVTAFRPSMIEHPFYTSGGASDYSYYAEPPRLTGSKALLDVQVDDDDDTEVMMTEDNIILMTVRYLPRNSFPMLTRVVTHSRVEDLERVLK